MHAQRRTATGAIIVVQEQRFQLLTARGQGIACKGAIMIWQRLQASLRNWSIPKQLAGADPQSTAAQSTHSRLLQPRLADADRVGTSICPYCAVGCAQLVYAKGNQVLHIEGDPRS
jgi:formate dehydrogenase major subunit